MRYEERDTIYLLLRAHASRHSRAAAICAPGRSPLTYGGLLDQVDGVVEFLNATGIHGNDRVAVVLPDGPEMAVAFVGVAATAVCAPANPVLSRREFEFYFSDLNPKALIVQSGTSSAAIAVAEKHGVTVLELLPQPQNPAGTFTLRYDGQQLAVHAVCPQPDKVALVLYTSGTTSVAKLVPLTHLNLLASARNIAAMLQVTKADRCLNVMPLFHIHGLVGTLLSSIIAGASVICTSGFDVEKFFSWLETLAPTWVTAVPTIYQAIVAQAENRAETIKRSPLRFIRSCSAPLLPRLAIELEEVFGAPVIEAYGMTEAAHQITSNSLPPAARKPGSVGKATGSEIAIVSESGVMQPAGVSGEVVIRGANVMRGYAGPDGANDGAFLRDWLRTGDLGYLDVDGYLFLTGRIKELINRGGEKISPREIDEVLTAHPAVSQAAAFPVSHPTLGEDVMAAVVLQSGAVAEPEEIRRFAASKLGDFKVPRQIFFVEEMPRSATGKIQRNRLDELLAHLLQPPFVAPESELERSLAGIIAEVLGIEQVGIRDNFFALGGDSLRAFQVLARIRDAFNVNLSIATVFRRANVVELSEEIQRVLADTSGERMQEW